jgi:serine/threonine protein kinase
MALIKKPGTTKGIGANASQSDAGADPQGTAAPGAGARIVAPVMQPGVILQGRYVIEGTLGIGGMSVVYRGRDLRFKDVVRPCAIKEMYQSAPDSNTRLLNLKNFEREAGLLATLQHPAIPKVFDFFEENGRVYLILELIHGKDLETVLSEAGGPLPEERVARWAVQLCEVLTYLHGQKPEPIVFRDMKPSNVMVTPRGSDRSDRLRHRAQPGTHSRHCDRYRRIFAARTVQRHR